MTRTEVTTDYTSRVYPGYNVMDIITTGLWDDTQVWQDDKYWWDAGILGTGYATRDIITTNYT